MFTLFNSVKHSIFHSNKDIICIEVFLRRWLKYNSVQDIKTIEVRIDNMAMNKEGFENV